MSIFEPRPNEMGAINPSTYKKPSPYKTMSLTKAPHSMVDFGGAVKIGEHMTPKAKAVLNKLAKATIPGDEAWEARHPEINDPKELEALRKLRHKRALMQAIVPPIFGTKTAKKNMPHFEDQDRPEKAKEVFHALKEEHPEYSAGKKARIANAVAAGTVKH